jgi:hypothetical protein
MSDGYALVTDSAGNLSWAEAGVTDHGQLTGLGDDDHTQYILVDGSRAFTGTVGGIDPVASSDLVTKNYVDGYFAGLEHGDLLGLGDDDHTQYLLVDGTRAMSGNLNLGSNDITNPGASTFSTIYGAGTDGTHGDVLFRGSSNWERLAAGSDGYVLTTHGAGSDLTWETKGSPALHASTHENGGQDEIDVTGLSGELADAQKVAVSKNSGATVGTRSTLNFIEGSNITLTIADDGGGDEVDITIDATGGAVDLDGYVVGPASATDEAIVRYDGTTGKLVQDSGITIDDTGNLLIRNSNELRFYDNGNYVGFEAPALAGNQIWVLPDADGDDGYALVTDGVGNLSWAEAGVTDHGALTGLGDDDHTQYLLVDGTRAMSGDLDLGNNDITNPGSSTFSTIYGAGTDGTHGDILFRGASNWERLAPGDDGYVLTTHDTGSDLTWEPKGSPALHASTHLPDNTDGLTVAVPVAIGDANAIGSANSFVRSDHVHQLAGTVSGDLNGSLPSPTVTDLTITNEEQGSVLFFDGYNWIQLAPAADGYVLTTHDTGADPTWAWPTVADYAYAESDGESSTSSTTFQQKLKLTATISGGTYQVDYSFTWRRTSTQGDAGFRVQLDDTTDLFNMELEASDSSSNQRNPVAGFKEVALSAGSHDFDIDFREVNGGSTTAIQQARIKIARVSD